MKWSYFDTLNSSTNWCTVPIDGKRWSEKAQYHSYLSVLGRRINIRCRQVTGYMWKELRAKIHKYVFLPVVMQKILNLSGLKV